MATTNTLPQDDPMRDQLIGEIDSYLKEKRNEVVSDPGVMRLLLAVGQYFMAQRDREKRQTNEETSPVLAALRTIEKRLDRIEKGNDEKPARKGYAAAAAKENRGATVDLTTARKDPMLSKSTPTGKMSLADQRKAKELIIKITDEKEKEEVQQTTTKELVEKMQGKAEEVVGISRLPSGDIKVFTRSKEAKEALQKNTDWTKVVAESAGVARRIYAVMAHGVRMSNVNTANQLAAIKFIQKPNARLHEGLQIAKMSWSTRAIKKKPFSSLRIEVETAEMANRLITEGLLEEYEMKRCERFAPEGRMIQCYNCQQYGHVAKSCKNETKCGHCAENHVSQDRKEKTTLNRRKCAVCLKVGHEAWSIDCEKRKEQKSKARRMQTTKPVLYKSEPTVENKTPEAEKSTQMAIDVIEDITVPEATKVLFTIVTKKRLRADRQRTERDRSAIEQYVQNIGAWA